jgi:hypothetical protein
VPRSRPETTAVVLRRAGSSLLLIGLHHAAPAFLNTKWERLGDAQGNVVILTRIDCFPDLGCAGLVANRDAHADVVVPSKTVTFPKTAIDNRRH